MSQEVIKRILRRWADGDVGALTGSTAPLVENDLRAAALSLSSENVASLKDIVTWMDDELPRECWGSKEARRAWVEKHAPPD